MGVLHRESTKSVIFRDFDDVLKSPFRYVHLFLLQTLLSKKIPKLSCMSCNIGSKVAVPQPPSPLSEGLALNSIFCPTSSRYQKHLKVGQCLEIDMTGDH